ncbi:hydrogenase expression/formation protein HypE [Limisalsivibrio acetivorans]|uniref:hydrogenase expression/formation protein HypE n=1 Tax=Limisalsivibrio acetivorans TaxID=1304888 RepID=UPI0003B7847C|nr:hydrogenase expression/formation protein HypE [Limisalsivibrio acetivorans]
MDRVTLSLGSGGSASASFVKEMIQTRFGNEYNKGLPDAAHLDIKGKVAFTTDSYVVRPEFFPGGDIGKLAVCGTVNDLAVSGARPRFLSLGLIIPEGYPFEQLERVLDSIKETSERAGVLIACGDTKVVDRNGADGLLINTAGIGEVIMDTASFERVCEGDAVIFTSDIARHGVSVLIERGELGFSGNIESDCAPLNGMLERIWDYDVKFVRDATRGGGAAVLNEIAEQSGMGILLREDDIPLSEDVANLCDMLGFDPLSVANEGLAVIIVSSDDSTKLLNTLKETPEGEKSALVGTITGDKRVIIETSIGGRRVVDMPAGELLPRIC